MTGQCSAYHKIVVVDMVFTTDLCNLSTIGNGEEVFEMGINLGGAVQSVKSLHDKMCTFIKFHE